MGWIYLSLGVLALALAIRARMYRKPRIAYDPADWEYQEAPPRELSADEKKDRKAREEHARRDAARMDVDHYSRVVSAHIQQKRAYAAELDAIKKDLRLFALLPTLQEDPRRYYAALSALAGKDQKALEKRRAALVKLIEREEETAHVARKRVLKARAVAGEDF